MCVCVCYLLLLLLRGRALQLSLAPDWLLTVWRVVHSRGSIGIQERLPWEVEVLILINIYVWCTEISPVYACVCYVPVCGFTNMLPGGIPFSMTKVEFGAASPTTGEGDWWGQADGSLNREMEPEWQKGWKVRWEEGAVLSWHRTTSHFNISVWFKKKKNTLHSSMLKTYCGAASRRLRILLPEYVKKTGGVVWKFTAMVWRIMVWVKFSHQNFHCFFVN